MTPKVAGDPAARGPTDVGRYELDDREQREGEGKGPREAIAELRPDLAVRADAAGVVVRRAGDEPRTELRQEVLPFLLSQPFALPAVAYCVQPLP